MKPQLYLSYCKLETCMGMGTVVILQFANSATKFWPHSATVVSAKPFSHGTGTLRCLQKEMATYRHWSVSLWWDQDDAPHCRILSRQNWMAAYLGYTLRMKTLFRGWPVMVNHTHTRRRSTNLRQYSWGDDESTYLKIIYLFVKYSLIAAV